MDVIFTFCLLHTQMRQSLQPTPSFVPSHAYHIPSRVKVTSAAWFRIPMSSDLILVILEGRISPSLLIVQVKNRTDDITRGTVQKSVCVLSRLPLYGQIQVDKNNVRFFIAILLVNDKHANNRHLLAVLGEDVADNAGVLRRGRLHGGGPDQPDLREPQRVSNVSTFFLQKRLIFQYLLFDLIDKSISLLTC